MLPGNTATNGLKAVPAEVWKDMLDLVNCKVLSVIESEHVDAYLLSESSMFVFPHKIILKTCGTTTLLCGLPRMLEIAALSAGFPHIVANSLKGIPAAATPYRVFYSRKNFLYPDMQRGPHRSWRDEVRTLDKMFLGGSAYMIGKMNGEHWYLYLTNPGTVLTPPATPKGEMCEGVETETIVLRFPSELAAASVSTADGCGEDETLEILMTDLDEENAKQFYLDHASAVAEGQYFDKARQALQCSQNSLGDIKGKDTSNMDDEIDIVSNTSSDCQDLQSPHNEPTFPEELTTEGHALGTVVSESSGLSEVYPASKYPDARVDAYLFTPCGFSANGVVPAQGGANSSSSVHYFTVHVTPEPHCSYASFETNVPSRQTGRETVEVIEQVVNIFKPGRFSVTLFEAKAHTDDNGYLDFQDESMRDMKSTTKRSSRMEAIKGYRRVDRIVHDLDGYDLVFRYYERYDWKGGAPRIGEIGF